MPSLPLPKCKVATCNERARARGKAYCTKHQRDEYRARARWESDPFYDSREWRAVSAEQKRKEPWCRECLKHDRVSPGKIADHIQPRSQGGHPFAPTNLQTLCERCHNSKRAAEREERRRSGQGRAGGVPGGPDAERQNSDK